MRLIVAAKLYKQQNEFIYFHLPRTKIRVIKVNSERENEQQIIVTLLSLTPSP